MNEWLDLFHYWQDLASEQQFVDLYIPNYLKNTIMILSLHSLLLTNNG